MAFLKRNEVVIDIVLTDEGRNILANNVSTISGSRMPFDFFRVADDDVDYTLYNQQHPSGSLFYGEAIENLPITQASTNTKNIKYFLSNTMYTI